MSSCHEEQREEKERWSQTRSVLGEASAQWWRKWWHITLPAAIHVKKAVTSGGMMYKSL
jgi:hypothetical protein